MHQWNYPIIGNAYVLNIICLIIRWMIITRDLETIGDI